jgi:hypothetical protein
MNSRKRSGEKDGDYSLVWFVLGCFFRAQEASVDLLGFCLDCSNQELYSAQACAHFFFGSLRTGECQKKNEWRPEEGERKLQRFCYSEKETIG